jgi:hypothetical protein
MALSLSELTSAAMSGSFPYRQVRKPSFGVSFRDITRSVLTPSHSSAVNFLVSSFWGSSDVVVAAAASLGAATLSSALGAVVGAVSRQCPFISYTI